MTRLAAGLGPREPSGERTFQELFGYLPKRTGYRRVLLRQVCEPGQAKREKASIDSDITTHPLMRD